MKKIVSLMLALTMALTLSACSGSKESTQDSIFKPGTYKGTGTGNNGDIVLNVTVDENSITGIEVVEHVETAGISDIAFERVPQSIIDQQSVAVDTVSTATNSSKGIIEAVTNALESTGADISTFLEAHDSASAHEGETIEKTADVIVVGGGGAGLAAAASASQEGATVIVVEKTPTLGGNTALSGGGYNCADPERQANYEMTDSHMKIINKLLDKEPHDEVEAELQKTVREELDAHLASDKADTLFDSPSFHMLQTYNGGDYKGNPELIHELCFNALDSLHWLESMGLEFPMTVQTVTGGLYDRGHVTTHPLGTGYIDILSENAKENGAEIIMEARANQLLTSEDGKVTGVVAEASNGDKYVLNANNAVVLATGGFGANVELREEVNTEWPTLNEKILTTNSPAITGDGLMMAKEVGAQWINMEDIQLLPLGDAKTGSLKGKIGKVPSDFIFVNKEGKRFVAEDARRDVMSKALIEQPDSYMYIIDDGDSYPTLDTKTNFNVTVGEMVEQGTVFAADTIEELADKIGVDAATLQATIDTYNASVDSKNDEFGKVTFTNKIDKAPFYACPRVPTVHHTMGGLAIDTDTHVLNTEGEIIPGLFAAGEVTGGVHGTNRLGGNAIADIMTFGRIAGRNAANNK